MSRFGVVRFHRSRLCTYHHASPASLLSIQPLLPPGPPVGPPLPCGDGYGGHLGDGHDVGSAPVTDRFTWLRDPAWAHETNRFLAKELEYATQVMRGSENGDDGGRIRKLQDQLYDEMCDCLQGVEASVPELSRGYYYYLRYDAGDNLPRFCRRDGTGARQPCTAAGVGVEQILFDPYDDCSGGGCCGGQQEQDGDQFLGLGAIKMSSDQAMVAYTLDT